MEPDETLPPPPPSSSLRTRIERNALWLALGAVALAGLVVAVGVQMDPERFYDHFWWEDIYGPLVVDAHQCKTDLDCPGVVAPGGVRAKDGYTVTSELTYGAVLAVLLYGIYVGLFRRYDIAADGHFVLALLPWIMLGPLARVLEDANVFCGAGTVPCADPSPWAFLFISPVIYVHIALYVIAAMLLGVYVRSRKDDATRVTVLVGGVLAAGFAVFAYVSLAQASLFSALPPLWLVGVFVLAAGAFFWSRAKRGLASLNLTVFVLGTPFALSCIYLVLRWLSGPENVWSKAAWSGAFYREAGAFILAVAALTAALVWALARWLVRSGAEQRWAALAAKVPEKRDKTIAYVGLAGILLAILAAGVYVPLADAFNYPILIPVGGLLGIALLAFYAFLQVGRGAAARPGVLLLFAAGINLALVFGHAMDGVATWVALEDPLGFGIPQYSEKHPFSEILLRYWNGFMFPAAKLLLVLVVAWVLDRETKRESLDERNLVGLVKMAIFVLGFAPGLRDVLRLSMGV